MAVKCSLDGVKFIHPPIGRVVFDVVVDALVFGVIADDVVVVSGIYF